MEAQFTEAQAVVRFQDQVALLDPAEALDQVVVPDLAEVWEGVLAVEVCIRDFKFCEV